MAELKIYIHSKGDASVGISDGYAEITIKDNYMYQSQNDMQLLLDNLGEIWDGTAITELTKLRLDLNESEQELNSLTLPDNTFENNTPAQTKEHIQHERQIRYVKKTITNLKRLISKVEKSYRQQNIWHKS